MAAVVTQLSLFTLSKEAATSATDALTNKGLGSEGRGVGDGGMGGGRAVLSDGCPIHHGRPRWWSEGGGVVDMQWWERW